MAKFLGFLLGAVVAFAGPAVLGVLAAPGGVELSARWMALAYGIGALILWAVVSYFSGASALGAALAFGAMIYAVHWIPNRTTNFLDRVPGVTTGMIDGLKQYTLNGVVPILAVISLVFSIQQIVRAVQRRRRAKAEAERARAEEDASLARQQAEAAAAYPAVAGGAYSAGAAQPASAGSAYGGSAGEGTSYADLFDDEPVAPKPRSQAEEETATFPDPTTSSGPTDTREMPVAGAKRAEPSVVDSPFAPAQQAPGASRPGDEQGESSDQPTQVVAADQPTQLSDADQPTRFVGAEPVSEPVSGPEDPTELAETPVRAEASGRAEEPGAAFDADQTVPAATPASVPDEPTEIAEAPAQAETAADDRAQSGSVEGAEVHVPQGSADEETQVAPADEQAEQEPESGEHPTRAREGGGEATRVMPDDGAGQGAREESGQEETRVAPEGDDTWVAGVAPGVKAEESGAEGNEATRLMPSDRDETVQFPAPGNEPKGPTARLASDERMGQQYRERMEDPEDTGEFFVQSFENPGPVTEPLPQAPRVMDVPTTPFRS